MSNLRTKAKEASENRANEQKAEEERLQGVSATKARDNLKRLLKEKMEEDVDVSNAEIVSASNGLGSIAIVTVDNIRIAAAPLDTSTLNETKFGLFAMYKCQRCQDQDVASDEIESLADLGDFLNSKIVCEGCATDEDMRRIRISPF